MAHSHKFILQVEEDGDVCLHEEDGEHIDGNTASQSINAMIDIMSHADNHQEHGEYHILVEYHPFSEDTP